MDLYERIIELSSMGYHCSQMIMILTLETIEIGRASCRERV